MHTDISFEELVANRQAAKVEEERAVARRRELDAQIAEALRDPARPEGSISTQVAGHKVRVIYGVVRKVDSARLQREWDAVGATCGDAFRFKAEVNMDQFRRLTPEAALLASLYIESKPASPVVAVEAITKE